MGSPVIVSRTRSAHSGYPAYNVWCAEIDSVLGMGTCARTSPSLLQRLYLQGLPSGRAAAMLVMPQALSGAGSVRSPMIVGRRGYLVG